MQESSTLPDGTVVDVTLQNITTIDPSSSTGFLNLLSSSYPDWTFSTAPLSASTGIFYDIYYYDAVAPGPQGPVVGAQMIFSYAVGSGAPDPSNRDLHWIQRVTSNHAVSKPTIFSPPILSPHGTSEDKIDVVGTQLNPKSPDYNPFYDTYGQATESSFLDYPTRPNVTDPHDWIAETYLAELTAPKTVTLYEGIRWGWENTVTLPLLDISLLFDTTGSMGSAIEGVKEKALELVGELLEDRPGTRVSVAEYRDFPTSPYGDPGDFTYQPRLGFSSDINAINNAIDSLAVDGGGDFPESAYTALVNTIDGQGIGDWREDAKKTIILMTDAPPQDPEPFTGFTAQSVIDASQNSPFVANGGVSAPLDLGGSTYDLLLAGEEFPIAFDEEQQFERNPISIYSVVLGGHSSAVDALLPISQQTGGQLYQPSKLVDGLAQALADIRNDGGLPSSEGSVSVPEPLSSLALLGLGVTALGLKRK
ncbi:MAG: vWA domain-containing protein [Cyanobacteria bacterium P01_G01_bin.54]